MRRGRNLREIKSKMISRKKTISAADRRAEIRKQLLESKRKKHRVVVLNTNESTAVIMPERAPVSARRSRQRKRLRAQSLGVKTLSGVIKKTLSGVIKPITSPVEFHGFVPTTKYVYKSRPARIAHIIESLGLGGAQTMMLEMANALSKYYPESVGCNFVICLHRKEQNGLKGLYQSYGVTPLSLHPDNLNRFLSQYEIDVVVHHRISPSQCIRDLLPAKTGYVLVNHTWHNSIKLRTFSRCDFYVSVCNFLLNDAKWDQRVHKSRRLVILNGVENEYIEALQPHSVPNAFMTGRCHRMVPGKFRIASLESLNKSFGKDGKLIHFLLGNSPLVRSVAKKYPWLRYMGSVQDRKAKMSIIKALDVYYYNTYQPEGASIAILESLAAGVPVLCKSLGGNSELVVNKVNGYILKDSGSFDTKIHQLMKHPEILQSLKQSTIDDFNDRLHVRHTVCKYMQLFEYLVLQNA